MKFDKEPKDRDGAEALIWETIAHILTLDHGVHTIDLYAGRYLIAGEVEIYEEFTGFEGNSEDVFYDNFYKLSLYVESMYMWEGSKEFSDVKPIIEKLWKN